MAATLLTRKSALWCAGICFFLLQFAFLATILFSLRTDVIALRTDVIALRKDAIAIRSDVHELRASVAADRTELFSSQLKDVYDVAPQMAIFISEPKCTGFGYETPSGKRVVVTAGHCVAECSDRLPATAEEGKCTLKPFAYNLSVVYKDFSGNRVDSKCSLSKLLWKRAVFSPDIAILSCSFGQFKDSARSLAAGEQAVADITPEGDLEQRKQHPVLRRPQHALGQNTPLAIVGIASDSFLDGSMHFAPYTSLRIHNTRRVTSAGVGQAGLSAGATGVIRLASGATVNTSYYDVSGFTDASPSPGMSGGAVVDADGAVIGVLVASAQHGIFAGIEAVDAAL